MTLPRPSPVSHRELLRALGLFAQKQFKGLQYQLKTVVAPDLTESHL